VSLQAAVTVSAGTTVIHLIGELDMSTVGTLREAAQAHLPGGGGRLLIDLAELTFCDSLGLGTLRVLSRTARAHNALLVLTHPSPYFLRMVEIAGVGAGLTIAPDEADDH
jgi:anti-sigma B factor antagonist